VSTTPLNPGGPFGVFADELVRRELPGLPDDRRADAVAFACRRADETPGPLRVGVVTLAVGVGVANRLLGVGRTTDFLRSTHLPFVGELARLVRSLAFAFVWETWPDTRPDGAPATQPVPTGTGS
jgi:hypothetical protein